jgi:hypothetical protein
VYTLFVPPSPTPDCQAEPVPPSCSLILLKRKHKREWERHIIFLLWDEGSYTERFLALLPCTCVLQPTLVHLYQTSSLVPGPLPIVASASLRLLYSLFNSEHINHIQVLVSFPFPISSMCVLPLVCDPCPIILLHLFGVYNLHMRENMWFLAFWAWLTSLKWCSLVPSIYLWMTKFHSSLWLNKVPLCINTTFSWSICW